MYCLLKHRIIAFLQPMTVFLHKLFNKEIAHTKREDKMRTHKPYQKYSQ